MKKFLLRFFMIAVVLVGMGGFAAPVYAAEFDEDGVVAAGEVVADDLFLAGDKVSMLGEVQGNLVTGGQEVVIGGTVRGDLIVGANRLVLLPGSVVEGNLFAGAASVRLEGEVQGSVFLGSAYLNVEPTASIGANFYSGSYALDLEKGAVIQRDLFAGSAQARLAGQVGRDVNLGAAAVSVEGKIGRNLKVDLGDAAETDAPFQPNLFISDVPAGDIPAGVALGFNVAESAKIGGKLDYTSSLDLSAGIKSQPAGGVVFSTPVPGEGYDNYRDNAYGFERAFAEKSVGDWFWNNAQLMLALLVLGLVVVYTAQKPLVAVANKAKAEIWTSFGWGLLIIPAVYLASIVVFIAIILLSLFLWAVTLGGFGFNVFAILSLALGLGMALFGFLIKYGTALAAVWLIGEFLREKLFPNTGKIVALLLGVFVFSVLAAIPVLGGLFMVFVAFAGVGAAWNLLVSRKSAPNDPNGMVTISA